jgi:trans-aconitate methyltransferase
MKDCIGIEKVVHGRNWDAVHGGYFSDPAVARPLIETVEDILARSPADVVVDLGGGTGFLLSQLASRGVATPSVMVNLDCSQAQLAQTDERGISSVWTSVGDFRRRDIAGSDVRFLYLMRSVLHYVGEEGLSPLLRHLRDQAREGEFFIHQTASFDDEKEAACLNTLYQRMHTHKWYPTVGDLKRRLASVGWHVLAAIPAPSLPLASEDLARRYGLDAGEIHRIRDTMEIQFGEMDDVLQLTPPGFQASLHYRIYTCVARPQNRRAMHA